MSLPVFKLRGGCQATVIHPYLWRLQPLSSIGWTPVFPGVLQQFIPGVLQKYPVKLIIERDNFLKLVKICT